MKAEIPRVLALLAISVSLVSCSHQVHSGLPSVAASVKSPGLNNTYRTKKSGFSSIVQTASASQLNTSTISPSFVVGPRAGDLLIAAVWLQNSAATLTLPSGWKDITTETGGTPPTNPIQAGTDCSLQVVMHIVAAGDPPSYTFTSSLSTSIAASMYEITGENPADPIDGAASAGIVNDASGNLSVTATPPGSALEMPNEVVLAFFAESYWSQFQDWATPGSGWTDDGIIQFSPSSGALDPQHIYLGASTTPPTASVHFPVT
ncbi:MAG: hypothetical protein JOY59_00330, partial [Candidatus Eremiobacteraeota bacterium]|nr:hypothetical protein [Candidatus Eremiobacteraeota bacterium]